MTMERSICRKLSPSNTDAKLSVCKPPQIFMRVGVTLASNQRRMRIGPCSQLLGFSGPVFCKKFFDSRSRRV